MVAIPLLIQFSVHGGLNRLDAYGIARTAGTLTNVKSRRSSGSDPWSTFVFDGPQLGRDRHSRKPALDAIFMRQLADSPKPYSPY
jgi:hypothetical protein